MFDFKLQQQPVLGLFLILLLASFVFVLSWGVAIVWSAHGEWWLRILPEFVKRSMYSLLKSILSADISEAEDQLNFYIFWVPSFIITALIAIIVYCKFR